jgi:hypothetical protein
MLANPEGLAAAIPATIRTGSCPPLPPIGSCQYWHFSSIRMLADCTRLTGQLTHGVTMKTPSLGRHGMLLVLLGGNYRIFTQLVKTVPYFHFHQILLPQKSPLLKTLAFYHFLLPRLLIASF